MRAKLARVQNARYHTAVKRLSMREKLQEHRTTFVLGSIKFLWLGQIHDPSGVTPAALDNALSTLLSCCSQHFFPVRVLASFIHLLPVVTLSDRDSKLKQIAAATGFRMSTLLTPKNFISEGQKNLVNSENKENLSNYRLLKRKPSVCSTSLHFSKLITVVQFFFSRNNGSAIVSIKFCAGNFRGRRPGTSALRMLLRLTAVKPDINLTDILYSPQFNSHQETNMAARRTQRSNIYDLTEKIRGL